jgi:tRNA threonylcarbamoyladenosine biosynthesis protein TsaB
MLRVLALETSTLVAGVALWEAAAAPAEPRLLGEIEVQSRPNHADVLMRQVETLLGLCELTMADVTAIAVGAGPGSFTGLRIGYATAKGLAYASGAKLVAVPSLLALAQAGTAYRGPVMAALDARRGEVFVAEHQGQGGQGPALPGIPIPDAPQGAYAASPALLAERIARLAESAARPVLGLGSGFAAFASELAVARQVGQLVVQEHPLAPPARWVGRLAIDRVAAGQLEDLSTSAPLYIRPPDAIVHRPSLSDDGSGSAPR